MAKKSVQFWCTINFTPSRLVDELYLELFAVSRARQRSVTEPAETHKDSQLPQNSSPKQRLMRYGTIRQAYIYVRSEADETANLV